MSKKKSKGFFSGLFEAKKSKDISMSAARHDDDDVYDDFDDQIMERQMPMPRSLSAARHDSHDFDDQIIERHMVLECHVDRQLNDDNRYEVNSGGVLSNNSDEIAEREQLSDLLHDTVQKVWMEESKQSPLDQIQKSDMIAESAKKDAMAEEKIVSRAAEPLQKEKIEQTLAQILAISAQSPVQPFPTGKPTFQDVIKRQHNIGFWSGN